MTWRLKHGRSTKKGGYDRLCLFVRLCEILSILLTIKTSKQRKHGSSKKNVLIKQKTLFPAVLYKNLKKNELTTTY